MTQQAADMAAMRSASVLASTAPLPTNDGVPPAQAPLSSDAILQLMARLMAGGGGVAPSVVAPPVIHVVAATSESKRQDLNRVQGIKGLFGVVEFRAAWQVMDVDQHGCPASYNVLFAEERLCALMARSKGQNVQLVAKEFLRRVALFLWNAGEGGLFLEHFLEPKGKINCWSSF